MERTSHDGVHLDCLDITVVPRFRLCVLVSRHSLVGIVQIGLVGFLEVPVGCLVTMCRLA